MTTDGSDAASVGSPPGTARVHRALAAARARGIAASGIAALGIAAFGIAALGCGQGEPRSAPAGSLGGGVDAGAGGGGSAGPGDRGDAAGHGSPGAEPDTWTYLLYMVADNGLEAFVADDLKQLMQVGSGEKLTILAQVDRAAGGDDGAIGGIPDFTTAKRVRVEPGRLTELADLGEVDSGSGSTFAEFMNWGVETAPADHYALVLWDHGGAWGRFGADASSQNDGLSLSELTRALDVTRAAHELRGPLDLIGFDACLLGTWEVAVALQGSARYLLASEGLEPGHGWDQRSIGRLRRGGEASSLGAALVDGYAEQTRQQGGSASATLALTDLSRISSVSDAISALTVALSEGDVAAQRAAVGRSRAAAGVFGGMPRGSTSSMIDLRLWTQDLLEQLPSVSAPVLAVQAALDSAVVAEVAGDAYAGAGGLSIYFPIVDALYDRAYDELFEIDAWRSFLKEYHAAGKALAPLPSFAGTGGAASLARVDGQLTVSGTLQAGSFADVASTRLDFGLYGADGTSFFLGEKPATLSASGEVSAVWDGQALQMSQGSLTDYAAYVIERASNDVSTLAIPLEYTSDDELSSVVLQVAVDASGAVLSQRYFQELDGAWAEHAPAPGSTLAAIVPTLQPSASEVVDVAQRATFDGAAPIELRYVPLGSGTNVVVRLRATDYGGHTVSVESSGTL